MAKPVVSRAFILTRWFCCMSIEVFAAMPKMSADLNMARDARRASAVSAYVASAEASLARPTKGPGRCIWLTGLSGAGKTTIAKAIAADLAQNGVRIHLLDGDEVRKVLSSDLGFGAEDRSENIRRISDVARLLAGDGLVVIVACISPFADARQAARDCFEAGQFVEVFVNTPLNVCEARDCKGLYRKARAGIVAEFTGVSSPYEPPAAAEIVVSSDGTQTPHDIARDVICRVFSG